MDYRIGRTALAKGELLFLFNEREQEDEVRVKLDENAVISDYWTDESLGCFEKGSLNITLPAHSARVFRVEKSC